MKTEILPPDNRYSCCGCFRRNWPRPFRLRLPKWRNRAIGRRRGSKAGRSRKTIEPFFSFTYDGKPSAEFLKTWELKRSSRQARRQTDRTHAHLHRSEDRLGIALRRRRISRLSHGRMDALFQEYGRQGHADPRRHPGPRRQLHPTRRKASSLLHHAQGDTCAAEQLSAARDAACARLGKTIRPRRRPADQQRMSLFQPRISRRRGNDRRRRLAGPMGGEFTRDKENHLRIRAGQELTHFKLLPGEEVRSPLIVLSSGRAAIICARRTSGGGG